MISLLALTQPMDRGEYLMSPQLLWSQGSSSCCLGFKKLIWFMSLMAPSSQSIVKSLSNVKTAEFLLSNWMSHGELLYQLLIFITHWLFPSSSSQVKSSLPSPDLSPTCTPLTPLLPGMCPHNPPARGDGPHTRLGFTVNIKLPEGALNHLLMHLSQMVVNSPHSLLLFESESWSELTLAGFLLFTSSYCAGWHFASALTRQLDMKSSH